MGLDATIHVLHKHFFSTKGISEKLEDPEKEGFTKASFNLNSDRYLFYFLEKFWREHAKCKWKCFQLPNGGFSNDWANTETDQEYGVLHENPYGGDGFISITGKELAKVVDSPEARVGEFNTSVLMFIAEHFSDNQVIFFLH